MRVYIHTFCIFQEQQRILTSLYGNRLPLKRNDCKEIFSTTGLDLDGSISFIEKLVPYLEPHTTDVLDWCSKVPGLNRLPHPDQVKLIRGKIGLTYSQWIEALSTFMKSFVHISLKYCQ